MITDCRLRGLIPCDERLLGRGFFLVAESGNISAMTNEPIERGALTWQPAVDAWANSSLSDFAEHVVALGGPTCSDYAELLDWSIGEPGPFWAAVASWQCIHWHAEPSASLVGGTMPDVTWFPGGALNYAERMLAWASEQPDEMAIIELSQSRDRRETTWAQLVDQVGRCRAGLIERGVGRGDRVVAFSPNISETLVAFLATASLGAIWSSCAPEFGVRAVTDRWAQIEPKVLIAVDGYMYGTQRIDRSAHIDQIAAALPSLEHIVHIGYLQPEGDLSTDARVCSWDALLADHA
ncbi:MAG: acetoacetyl-CoA synthetase, partial [Ilumatobacter sp.]